MASRGVKNPARRKAAPPRTRPVKVRRRAGAAATPAPVVPVEATATDHETSQVFVPRPVHFRLLDAYEASLQDGTNPSDSAIAKRLGVARETVNRWRRRRAGVWRWVHDHIGQRAIELKPIVDRRVAALAISGSPEHTKLYYQFVAKVAVPMGEEPGALSTFAVHYNFLVPRSEAPQLALQAPAPAVKVSTVPVVTVTR